MCTRHSPILARSGLGGVGVSGFGGANRLGGVNVGLLVGDGIAHRIAVDGDGLAVAIAAEWKRFRGRSG